MAYQQVVVDLTSLPPTQTVLNAAELAFYQTLKLPKRKTEWLGGRFALKQLLSAYLGRALTDFTVLVPGGIGKPTVLLDAQPLSIAFSLTHSNGYAVAAIAPHAKYLGIDLEKITPRMHAWKTDFFHPSELTREDDKFLTALWTQKEAVVKLLGSGLTLNSYDVRIINNTPHFLGRAQEIYAALGSPPITLQTCALIPGFIFSVALAP